jgi:hypothetical protein
VIVFVGFVRPGSRHAEARSIRSPRLHRRRSRLQRAYAKAGVTPAFGQVHRSATWFPDRRRDAVSCSCAVCGADDRFLGGPSVSPTFGARSV